MLQELATGTSATGWVVASLLFFVAVYVLVTVIVWRARDEDLEATARLALDDGREQA